MNILITEPEDYSSQALEIYARMGNVILLPNLAEPLETAIVTADVLVIRLHHAINKNLLDKGVRLKYIISPTTGLDHIDEKVASEKGIAIISLRGESDFLAGIPSTAEFTWGLLLALIRHIPVAAAHAAAGGWNRNLFKGRNLQGKKLGILGLGRVGKQVVRYASAFEMECMAFDPYVSEWVDGVQKASSADELFGWCDILSIHIPLTDNEGFVSDPLLRQLKPGALLLNTSRGAVWDKDAVAQLLADGHLGGVATDVLTNELNPNIRRHSPLLALANKGFNLIITPHIAGATYESMEATENFVAEKLRERLRKPDAHVL